MNKYGRQSGHQGHSIFPWLLFLKDTQRANQKHIKSVYYICALRCNYTVGMADGTGAGQNLDFAIASLKGIREDISLLEGMFSTIKKWSHITDSARNKIDNTLYELAGSDFYKPKEGRNPL